MDLKSAKIYLTFFLKEHKIFLLRIYVKCVNI